ncbi:putative zinc-binding metallopeptidase [Paralimibaculum aggregatum]|uniref:Zinc-binding metallopeptidase n=1 Tax=Paralimibaculum aggregatum TaxID=3036245 RepID=A0ABQ6LNR8_9RHOB|nr:putative zinc-binding metallopeptidase [Limibaculum sp. NKW23]GMG82071.1 putative zinc-binding metallopeptidase [Limibaculum sp. NKW23]
MKLFGCPDCGAPLFFSNTDCAGCNQPVAFDPETQRFLIGAMPCSKRDEIGCNWRAEPGAAESRCRSCAMTEVIPDTFHGENRGLWAEAETAKRWVLAGLSRWGWFGNRDPGARPVFHLLAEDTPTGPATVIMGHDNGLVTINITEVDPVARITRREHLGERLRTMIDHFRHEIAHFLFLRLAERSGFHANFRHVFGDEQADYAAALERFYAEGPAPDHAAQFITAYARAHPHEDWAETAAHVLHLTDLLDSALAAGLTGRGLPEPGHDAYAETDSARLLQRAVRLTIALNHANRAIGLQDVYPFVLSLPVRRKLGRAHEWLSCGPAQG